MFQQTPKDTMCHMTNNASMSQNKIFWTSDQNYNEGDVLNYEGFSKRCILSTDFYQKT